MNLREQDLLMDKLAEIRDTLFSEKDPEQQNVAPGELIGSPYAVVCYIEEMLKRLIDENKIKKGE